jgi:hypothetical protein
MITARFGYVSSLPYIPCSFSLQGTPQSPKKYTHTQNHTASLNPSIPLPAHLGIPLYSPPLRLSFQLASCTVTHARPSASSPTRITSRRSRLKHGERKHATEAKLHPPVCDTIQCFSCENDSGDVHASILLGENVAFRTCGACSGLYGSERSCERHVCLV